MKKYKSSNTRIIIYLISVLLVSCAGKTGKDFVVSGSLLNTHTTMVYLEEVPIANMQPRIVDSSPVRKDGHYSLQATPIEENLYQVRLDKYVYPVATVINDVSKITLNAVFGPSGDEFAEDYEVKGSPASAQMKDFIHGYSNRLKDLYFKDRKIDSLQQAVADSNILEELATDRNKVAAEFRDFCIQTVNKSESPALSMFALSYYQTTANQNPQLKVEPIGNDQLLTLLKNMAGRFPNHQGVASIIKIATSQLTKSTGWVGKPAPEIALSDTKGNEIKLSSFRGKYVLVDFWASWCKPCRHENPNVVSAYTRFRDKNFTILGVSLDTDKDSWLNAIKEDGLAWTHISDLKGWKSAAIPLYNIEFIPFNVLVDTDGKVIAQNLSGKKIEEKLEEVLK